jgi:hypothetical protein
MLQVARSLLGMRRKSGESQAIVRRSKAIVKTAVISLHLTQSLTTQALHQKMNQKPLKSEVLEA